MNLYTGRNKEINPGIVLFLTLETCNHLNHYSFFAAWTLSTREPHFIFESNTTKNLHFGIQNKQYYSCVPTSHNIIIRYTIDMPRLFKCGRAIQGEIDEKLIFCRIIKTKYKIQGT